MPRAVLTARRDVGGGLMLASLDVDDEAAAKYTSPGQYVQVLAQNESAYFVLASDVRTRPWQILVRNAGDAAAHLYSLDLGAAVEVNGPLGRGFPEERWQNRPLVVAVVASALGVARALVDARIAEGLATSTWFYIGVRAAADVPLADEVTAWRERGVHVVLCLSREELEHHKELLPLAAREPGYVQAVIGRAAADARLPDGALVVAAGPAGMLADLRAVVTAAGAAKLELLTNVG
jgi:NAD(P)H-flavin reductase